MNDKAAIEAWAKSFAEGYQPGDKIERVGLAFVNVSDLHRGIDAIGAMVEKRALENYKKIMEAKANERKED